MDPLLAERSETGTGFTSEVLRSETSDCRFAGSRVLNSELRKFTLQATT